MDSSDDSVSIELYEDAPRFVPTGKDCQQLFDDLFRHDADGRPDDNLPVKKPTRTYQRKPLRNIANQQQQHIDVDNFDGFSSENDDDDVSDGEEEHHEEIQKKVKKRKKRSKLPKCTKTGVLKAYQKAIEMNELPDFDNIELEELNIVNEEPPASSVSENEPFDRDLCSHLETQTEHNDIDNLENLENDLRFTKENSRYPLRRKTNNLNSTYNVMNSSPNNVSNRSRRRLRNIINIDKSIIQSTNKHIKNSTPVRTKQKKKSQKSKKQPSLSSPAGLFTIRDISNSNF